MICAYDEVYLEKARIALGRMLDFAVYELRYDMTEFWNLFLASGVAARFGSGDFTLLAGKSGVEITYEVLEHAGIAHQRIKPQYTADRSEEYWTGWALAYYQWKTAIPFAEITRHVPVREVLLLYSPYHEMDIRQFVDKMNQLYKREKQDTKLKQLRRQAEFSQRQLAQLSGIPIRTIQQYEQGQKNINKARAEYLICLANVLHCQVTDLMEWVE